MSSPEPGPIVEDDVMIADDFVASSGEGEEIELVPLTSAGPYYTTAKKSPSRRIVRLRRLRKIFLFSVIFTCVVLLCVVVLSGVIVGCVFLVIHFQSVSNIQFMRDRNTLIVLSIDGFRWDYLTLYPDTYPNMKEFILDRGIRLDALQPVYPTKTFPNHYSIATGLYPVHHGLVSNTMWDPLFQAVYSIGDREAVLNSSWYGGEPIWVTCELDDDCSSFIVFWPGSEVEIEGVRPSFYARYDSSLPYSTRMEMLLGALKRDKRESRPNLLMGYFEGVDHAGHEYGPDDPDVATQIHDVDDAIGLLMSGLKDQGILDFVNVIVVSDHGMTPISPQRRINLDEIIAMGAVNVYNYGPFVGVWPHSESEILSLFETLNASETLRKHATPYLKHQIPERLHMIHGEFTRRVPPIWIITDNEWFTTESSRQFSMCGTHGYDNLVDNMQALTMGTGPRIRNENGNAVEGFLNINLYPLFAEILGINGAKVDGSIENSKHLLRNQ